MSIARREQQSPRTTMSKGGAVGSPTAAAARPTRPEQAGRGGRLAGERPPERMDEHLEEDPPSRLEHLVDHDRTG